jgi:hypothetical protein
MIRFAATRITPHTTDKPPKWVTLCNMLRSCRLTILPSSEGGAKKPTAMASSPTKKKTWQPVIHTGRGKRIGCYRRRVFLVPFLQRHDPQRRYDAQPESV